jgi:hypothetical protein
MPAQHAGRDGQRQGNAGLSRFCLTPQKNIGSKSRTCAAKRTFSQTIERLWRDSPPFRKKP